MSWSKKKRMNVNLQTHFKSVPTFLSHIIDNADCLHTLYQLYIHSISCLYTRASPLSHSANLIVPMHICMSYKWWSFHDNVWPFTWHFTHFVLSVCPYRTCRQNLKILVANSCSERLLRISSHQSVTTNSRWVLCVKLYLYTLAKPVYRWAMLVGSSIV